MRNRTYGDLFKLVRSLAGVGTFAPSEVDDVENLINRRFAEAYNSSQMWPRYLVNGEPRTIVAGRTVQTSEDSIHIYGAGDSDVNGLYRRNELVTQIPTFTKYDSNEIKIGNELFSLVSDGTMGYIVKGTPSLSISTSPRLYQGTMQSETTPISYPASGWTALSGSSPAPFAQDLSYIGEFQRIHSDEPFVNNSAKEYEFFVTSRGAEILNVRNNNAGLAYVTYKKDFVPFAVITNHSASTDLVPEEFFEFIAHAAYADFLRMDGQTDKALAEEQRAQVYLALELERVDIMSNNNTINKRFSTYVNRQSR